MFITPSGTTFCSRFWGHDSFEFNILINHHICISLNKPVLTVWEMTDKPCGCPIWHGAYLDRWDPLERRAHALGQLRGRVLVFLKTPLGPGSSATPLKRMEPSETTPHWPTNLKCKTIVVRVGVEKDVVIIINFFLTKERVSIRFQWHWPDILPWQSRHVTTTRPIQKLLNII
jgi:hypothetical protein